MNIIGSGTRERDYSKRGLPNRWIGWVSYEDPRAKDGRRRQQSEFATEREAEAWVRFKVAENAVAPQAARASGRETVGSLLEDYYRHGVDVADWSPRHRDNTRRIIDGHLEPLHHLRVADLLVEDVDDLVAGLRARGISPHTLRQVRNALRAAFNFGIARRRIPQGHNPAALVEVTDTTRRPPKFVPPDRLGAFVEAVEGDWYGAFFLTTALLALRPSEAIGLQWRDVDLAAGTVTIRRTLHHVRNEGYVERPPKTHQERSLNIGADLVALLEAHRTRTIDALGHGWEPTDVVFPAPTGGFIYEPRARARLRKLLKPAGLEGVTLYQLRHTGGTLRQFAGVPLGVIQEEMGHSTLQMTRRYVQVVESMRKGSADAVDAIFKAAREARGGTSGGTTEPTPLSRRRRKS